jgi:hypothetical protein
MSEFSAEIFQEVLSIPLLDHLQPAKVAALMQTFEKRHPITHNLGIVDRKCLERLQSLNVRVERLASGPSILPLP